MSSNLNLEISNLALNINQTTKEEIAEMITEECEDKYSLKDHTHDSFDTLTINKDIMIPNEEENSGYTLLKSGAFYSYDKDRQIDCTLDGIHIHNFTDNNTMYIGPGSISVNGQSVSFEGHTHDYAASNHTHTMADITDLELPEIDTSNLATKEELNGKADANHTHSTYDAAYQRVNELKEVYSWNTGYNGTGTQTTANIIANGGLTVNNKAVSMEGHTHDYAPSDHNHNELKGNVNITGGVSSGLGFSVRDENDLTTFSRITDMGFDAYTGPEDDLTTTHVYPGSITLQYTTTQYGGRQRYTSIDTNGISIDSDLYPSIQINGKKVSLEDHTHSEYATKEELAGKADANHKHEYIEISNSNYWLFIDKSCISLTYFDTNESVSIYTGYILLNKDGANMYIYPDRIEWKKNHSTSPITLSFDESGAYINGKKILTE